MTTKEIIKLKPGTKVFLIKDSNIEPWVILGFNPNFPQYFYLYGNGSVEKTLCLFLDGGVNHSVNNLHWEIDYELSKKVMWEQLKEKVKVINQIYMNDKESLNFEKIV